MFLWCQLNATFYYKKWIKEVNYILLGGIYMSVAKLLNKKNSETLAKADS